jgi:hypothetical protein
MKSAVLGAAVLRDRIAENLQPWKFSKITRCSNQGILPTLSNTPRDKAITRSSSSWVIAPRRVSRAANSRNAIVRGRGGQGVYDLIRPGELEVVGKSAAAAGADERPPPRHHADKIDEYHPAGMTTVTASPRPTLVSLLGSLLFP